MFECPKVAKSASVAFVGFMQNQQFDSAQIVLKNWTQKCGICEPILRANVILAIATNRPIDSFINEENMRLIYDYQRRGRIIENRSAEDNSIYQWNWGYVPIGMEFDSFTISYFREIKVRKQDNSLEYLLSSIYSNTNDDMYIALQKQEYKETSLAKEYYKLVNKYINKPDFNMAFLAGIWIPTGGIAKLGLHPDVGVQLGSKYRKVSIDMTIMFKFGNSPNPYYATRVRSDKSTVLTDNFFGAYMGIDVGKDIWRKNNKELQMLFGAGVDGFDALEADTIRNLKAESTWTYNINTGIGYRYYINNWTYVGMRVKYNIVDYALNGVINFNGHPITLTFCIGGLSNKNKRHGLEYLKYSWKR
ncbi:hypothetical protein CAP35_06640 [Chitinophagaceae bacterium IBVUCB1]|nr:hypothetical protein CAP35_06640 [Chitinophagaceae bacterium IBVUCB1]